MFTWPSADGGWIVVYFAGAFICIMISLMCIPDTFKEFFGVFFSLFATGVVVVNILSFVGSLGRTEYDPTDLRTAAAQFGLQSDKAYPLVLGSRIGSVQAQASASSGWFYANASVSAKPASILSVSYVHGDKSYILELPTSGITFVQSATAQPTVSIHLTTDPFDGVRQTYAYHGMNCHFSNLFFVCPGHRTQTLTVTDDTVRRGLSPIVSDGFDSATVTLTPTMYKEILGTP